MPQRLSSLPSLLPSDSAQNVPKLQQLEKSGYNNMARVFHQYHKDRKIEMTDAALNAFVRKIFCVVLPAGKKKKFSSLVDVYTRFASAMKARVARYAPKRNSNFATVNDYFCSVRIFNQWVRSVGLEAEALLSYEHDLIKLLGKDVAAECAFDPPELVVDDDEDGEAEHGEAKDAEVQDGESEDVDMPAAAVPAAAAAAAPVANAAPAAGASAHAAYGLFSSAYNSRPAPAPLPKGQSSLDLMWRGYTKSRAMVIEDD